VPLWDTTRNFSLWETQREGKKTVPLWDTTRNFSLWETQRAGSNQRSRKCSPGRSLAIGQGAEARRTSSGCGGTTWPQQCIECHPTFVAAPGDRNPISRLTTAICICSRSRLRRRICWLAKMQAGAMTGAMMGMSTGTLAGNWALAAHGDDSMPCYYCM